MRRISARLQGLKRKVSEKPCNQPDAKRPTQRRSDKEFVTLSPQEMGDVVAGEAARRQQWPDDEPYRDFGYYMQSAKLLRIATVDPDQIRGRTHPVGQAWRGWVPVTSIDQYFAHPRSVMAMSPSGMGFDHGFIFVARHDEDEVLWPIPRLPGSVQGRIWGWTRRDTVEGRFPVSDGSCKRSSLVSPTSVLAR